MLKLTDSPPTRTRAAFTLTTLCDGNAPFPPKGAVPYSKQTFATGTRLSPQKAQRRDSWQGERPLFAQLQAGRLRRKTVQHSWQGPCGA